VKSDRKMIKINFTEVNYIESLADYLKIHLNDKTILTRETITSIEAKLPKRDFLRIHRSYIISISRIESFTNEFVEINKKAIPISRSYKNDVKLRLDNV
jgi:DNA-binding LytR/AlgR family response regulator